MHSVDSIQWRRTNETSIVYNQSYLLFFLKKTYNVITAVIPQCRIKRIPNNIGFTNSIL